MPPKKHSRPILVSESDSDEEEETLNTCRGCQKKLTLIGWLKKHLERSKTDCMKKYTDDEYQSLEQKSIVKSKAKKSQYSHKNKEELSQYQQQYYQKNKEKKSGEISG